MIQLAFLITDLIIPIVILLLKLLVAIYLWKWLKSFLKK
jgi:hypothetical protein